VEYDTLAEEVVDRKRARPVDPATNEPEFQVPGVDAMAIGSGVRGSPALQPSAMKSLQRTAGNAAVTALIQRRLAAEEDEEESSAAAVRNIVGKAGGNPLDGALKEEMETRFGDDFSSVRIHTDAAAAESAAGVSARAYTVGDEVVFGAGSPALDSPEGKRTLAHELTHVIQQRQGPVAGTPVGGGISVSDPSDRYEQAADANADRVMAGGAGPDTTGGPGAVPAQRLLLQRDPLASEMAEDEEEEQEEEAASPGEAQMEAGAGSQVETGEAQQAVELAEAGQEEVATEASEEAASEVEVEEDVAGQEQAEMQTEEEEEEEAVV
jgi:hypothetical protein